MPTKRSSEDVITSILKTVSIEPSSILQIAGETDTDWKSTQKALELLASLNVVKEIKKGRKRLFFKDQHRDDTWFNLPIKKEDEQMINFVYHLLQKYKIGKTHANKILAVINSNYNLTLPIGWYLYGQLCVKKYDPEKEYVFTAPKNAKVITQAVHNIAKEYMLYSKKELKQKKYQEYNYQLYLIKEEIITSFHEKEISTWLLRMIPYLPQRNKDLIHLFTEFIGTVLEYEKHTKNKTNQLLLCFNEIWKLIAMQNFFESLMFYYSQPVLEQQILPYYYQQDEIVIEQFMQLEEELQKYRPKEELTEDEKTLYSLRGSASLKKKEPQTLPSSELFRKFGLD